MKDALIIIIILPLDSLIDQQVSILNGKGTKADSKQQEQILQ